MNPESPERLRAREAAVRRMLRSHRRLHVVSRVCRAFFTSPGTFAVLSTIVLAAALTRPSADAEIEVLLDRAMLCEVSQSPRARQHVQLIVFPFTVDSAATSRYAFKAPFVSIREATDGAVAEAWPELTQRRWTHMPGLVEAQGLDMRRPLSATRYWAWRRVLRDRRDTVVRQGDIVKLKTVSFDGPIREATLVIDSTTACVVAQTWNITSVGTVSFDLIEPR